MITTHNLGFPRIGPKRELKFALESYWQGKTSRDELQAIGKKLRQDNWRDQSALDFVPVGDFSFYDQVLDMSFMLGHLPQRVKNFQGDMLDNYFRLARGQSVLPSENHGSCCESVAAGEMTKWFDTNYHYIVPEFDELTDFKLDASRLLAQLDEAKQCGVRSKPVIIGPLSYLAIGKATNHVNRLDLLEQLLVVYAELFNMLAAQGVEWVQVDEPILVTELDADWQHAFKQAYYMLKSSPIKILVATYFGSLLENKYLAAHLPVAGLHIDVATDHEDLQPLLNLLPSNKILSLGVINGRNVWKTDLVKTLNWLEPVAQQLAHRLWIAPSCSLLHVPVDLAHESNMDEDIFSWLAFAKQKIAELQTLATALNFGRDKVKDELVANQVAIESKHTSTRVHNPMVKKAVEEINHTLGQRKSHFSHRTVKQNAQIKLPIFPTTTIGSFPQTVTIRQARSQYKSGSIDEPTYHKIMEAEIAQCVREQENLGLDVLVHGEAERNDMVEFFGEQLDGYAFSQYGWVQSYGSRCVKPPILFGDINRPQSMTVKWISFAQSLTQKPMKGMLTGPVTMLNWSFVRDDQPRSVSCQQLALSIRQEVLDLEKAGIQVIQIDEAALREGLPLRRSLWDDYLTWAINAFRIAANGVRDETQIHTHMCYSEFNDIIEAIADMDADVITIETSRSSMDLLDAFEHFNYPNEIGPGVYDIHSPNIPTENHIVNLMRKATKRIPAERLWVNPDCGLKTRQWSEVIPALRVMVNAARQLRQEFSN